MRQAQRTLWVFALVVCFIVTLATTAWSRPPLVVILETPANDAVTELVTRVEGELVAAGADVRRVQPPSAELEPASRVQVAAEALGAVAAFEIEVLAEGGVRIWMADRLGAEPVVRHLDVGVAAGPDANSTAAVRAVELLRVSFLERLMNLSKPPPPSKPSKPPPPKPRRHAAPAPAPAATLGLELGPAVLSSFQGMGHQLALAARVSYLPLPSFGARLNLLGLSRDTWVQSESGIASLDQQLAYADLVWLFGGKPVRPLLSGGVGAYHLDVEGTGGPGFVGQIQNFWGFSAVLGAGAAVSLSTMLTLSFSLNAVLVFPEPLVRLGETEAGRAGRPSMLASSMLGAWF